jgi:hypothetical protein
VAEFIKMDEPRLSGDILEAAGSGLGAQCRSEADKCVKNTTETPDEKIQDAAKRFKIENKY